jgi:hypothetical protein
MRGGAVAQKRGVNSRLRRSALKSKMQQTTESSLASARRWMNPPRPSRRSQKVVDLKFFRGLLFAEIALMRDDSDGTVQQWEKERIYLHRSIQTDLET